MHNVVITKTLYITLIVSIMSALIRQLLIVFCTCKKTIVSIWFLTLVNYIDYIGSVKFM